MDTQRTRANRNAWKSELTRQIVCIEDNLDQIYHNVGLKTHRVVQDDDSELENRLSLIQGDFMKVIDVHLDDIRHSVKNIRSLLCSVTEFDLPIPVNVLSRLALRLNSIRWQDYKKKISGTPVRRYIYSKVYLLIESGLSLFQSLIVALGTNIIPFQPSINQIVFNLLEWTRTSGLSRYDEAQYINIRTCLISTISIALDRLDMNINLEPKQLKSLVEDEFCQILESTNKNHQDLVCLEKLLLAYMNYLDASTDYKLKEQVIQACIRIYRDFERDSTPISCRRQLLRILETIANQPYASSTTELAWHIFQMADRMETDSEIKHLVRRSIKIGLAHRPIIVSHYDVHNLYGQPMNTFVGGAKDAEKGQPIAKDLSIEDVPQEEEPKSPQPVADQPKEKDEDEVEAAVPPVEEDMQQPIEVAAQGDEPRKDHDDEAQAEALDQDPEVMSYMKLFVDKQIK